jgi:hypothetical protein
MPKNKKKIINLKKCRLKNYVQIVIKCCFKNLALILPLEVKESSMTGSAINLNPSTRAVTYTFRSSYQDSSQNKP